MLAIVAALGFDNAGPQILPKVSTTTLKYQMLHISSKTLQWHLSK